MAAFTAAELEMIRQENNRRQREWWSSMPEEQRREKRRQYRLNTARNRQAREHGEYPEK